MGRRIRVGVALLCVVVAVHCGSRPDSSQLRQAMVSAEDGRASGKLALAPLMEGLSHPEVEVQRIAARAVGRLEQPGQITVLLPLLAADDPGVRAESANALAQALEGLKELDPPDAVNTVRAALEAQLSRERDGSVRAALFQSTGRLPYRTAEQVARAERTLARGLSDTAAEVANRSSLLGAVKGLESLIRLRAKLAQPERATLERLRGLVMGREVAAGDQPAQEQRRGAASGTTSGSMDPALIRRLALAALTAGAGVDDRTLEAAIGDEDDQVRRLAAVAAGEAESLQRRPALVGRSLGDPSFMVRYEGIRAYGRRLKPQGCGPLLDALVDPVPHVAVLAADLLGTDCLETGPIVTRLTELVVPPPIPQPDTLDAPASWHLAAHALVSLARLSPATAVPLLADFAGHPVWQVRMYAARAATLIPAAEVLDRLSADPKDNVREAALRGLAEINGHGADPVCLSSLERTDYQLVITAARALAGTPARRSAVPALLAALARLTLENRDTSRDPRMAILDRLEEVASPDQARDLQPYLNDFDPHVAAKAADILTAWTGSPHAPATTRMRTGPPPVLREVGEIVAARVTMEKGGAFDMRLFPLEAPATVARFASLARSGYYNGLTFHRVVPNFVIQGGSPGANEYMGDGPYMRDELGLRSHTRGTVGISTRGRDTGDAQIFVNLVDNPRLDHSYTVFAEVTRGMDVVDGILEGDAIASIEILVKNEDRPQ